MAEFGGSRQEWETHIFDLAGFFTASVKVGPGRFETLEFSTLPEALNAAWRGGQNTMVYAVTADGHSFMICRSEWKFYYLRWRKAQRSGAI